MDACGMGRRRRGGTLAPRQEAYSAGRSFFTSASDG
jgi:hypothetical protein